MHLPNLITFIHILTSLPIQQPFFLLYPLQHLCLLLTTFFLAIFPQAQIFKSSNKLLSPLMQHTFSQKFKKRELNIHNTTNSLHEIFLSPTKPHCYAHINCRTRSLSLHQNFISAHTHKLNTLCYFPLLVVCPTFLNPYKYGTFTYKH